MAEPQNLDEALEAYQNDKFSRKSLFVFVVNELKALRREHEDLKNRVTDYILGRNRFEPTAIPMPYDPYGVPTTNSPLPDLGTSTSLNEPPKDARASDANKEAARERMKKYWADKKAAEAAAKAAPAVQEATANG